MGEQDTLGDLRGRIDALDAELVRLLNERAQLAQAVAQVKRIDRETNFYRPEREAQILRHVTDLNPGPLGPETVTHLFREIMSACLALERPLEVAFLGPEGTFTEEAARKHFGQAVKFRSLNSIGEVFRQVEAGASDFGVVPVENSTEGMVTHTLDRFTDSTLKINGEVELKIHHHLLSAQAELKTIEVIYSHQQSFAQCRAWLDENLPKAERVALFSNAEAARRVTLEPMAAAIAGEAAARWYQLKVVSRNIEDRPDNTTRFLVIGRHRVAPSGMDKTSLLVSAANRPGALYRLLAPLAQHAVSMTRIESRPSRARNWEYVFFLDLEGHQEEASVHAALAQLEEESALFKLLGSYPRAVS